MERLATRSVPDIARRGTKGHTAHDAERCTLRSTGDQSVVRRRASRVWPTGNSARDMCDTLKRDTGPITIFQTARCARRRRIACRHDRGTIAHAGLRPLPGGPACEFSGARPHSVVHTRRCPKMLGSPGGHKKTRQLELAGSCLVAGIGFEPMTFRL